MPERKIGDWVCTDERINSLSAFEEAFFYRLLTKADGKGRIDARPEVLRSVLYPLKKVTLADIERAACKVVHVGLADVIEIDGRACLCVDEWGRYVRYAKKTTDESPCDDSGQARTTADNCGQRCPQLSAPPSSSSSSPPLSPFFPPTPPYYPPISPLTPSSSPPSHRACACASEDSKDGEVGGEGAALSALSEPLRVKAQQWLTYKTERREAYKETGLKSLVNALSRAAQQHGEAEVTALIDECMASGYKGIAFDRLARGVRPKGATSSGSAKKRAVDTATPSSSNIKEFSTWAFQAIYGKEGQDGDQQPQQGQEI